MISKISLVFKDSRNTNFDKLISIFSATASKITKNGLQKLASILILFFFTKISIQFFLQISQFNF